MRGSQDHLQPAALQRGGRPIEADEFRLRPACAGNTWMYGPVNTVRRPLMLAGPTSGRTIQNTEPSLVIDAAERRRRALRLAGLDPVAVLERNRDLGTELL